MLPKFTKTSIKECFLILRCKRCKKEYHLLFPLYESKLATTLLLNNKETFLHDCEDAGCGISELIGAIEKIEMDGTK